MIVASVASPLLTTHFVPAPHAKPDVVPAPAVISNHNMQVLSPEDAALYRQAFAAQENEDWVQADAALARIHDRLLEGHLLADRYNRRQATIGELRDWLVRYGDLPEAKQLYSQARFLPAFATLRLPPALGNVSDNWGGNGGYGLLTGFKAMNAGAGNPSRNALRIAARIDSALRHDRASQAETLLKTEQAKSHLAPAELAALQAQIAAGYFYNDQDEAARRLAALAAQGDSPLGLWINGLAAWRQNDGNTASWSFARLAVQPGLTPWDHAAAAFWAYRACKLTGNGAQANYWLRQAASQPHSFYGLMAAHLLAHNIVWSWEVPKFTNTSQAIIASNPAGRRALALLQVGQPNLAEAELRQLNPRSKNDMQQALLAMAEQNHMAGLAVQLGGITPKDNGKPFDAAYYPVPAWKPDQGFQVDRALLYALIRHESGFNPLAVSGAGACGLMQLMPSTAALMANDDKPTRKCSARLLQPGYNMALGQKYVRLLSNEAAIGDNLVMLLAAYNSGPGNAERWMGSGAQKDPLLFIETVPVKETRLYVEQVLIHYWSYRARLSEPQTALAQLARGDWPRYALRDEQQGQIRKAEATSRFEVASKQ